jgi:plasmid stabilization system protein ParE
MPSIPSGRTAAAETKESLEERFDRLAAEWRAGTAYISSSSELVAHPAYREIVRLGTPVIPFLLRELERRSGHWHRALHDITGIDPVATEHRGNIEKAAAAWLEWGREQGYEW